MENVVLGVLKLIGFTEACVLIGFMGLVAVCIHKRSAKERRRAMTRKFGRSYPPGVSDRDIPGNRPEDQEAETFYDAVFEAVASQDISEEPDLYSLREEGVNNLAEKLWEMMGESYAKGYGQGGSDEALAATFEKDSIKSIDTIVSYLRTQAHLRSEENNERGMLTSLADQLSVLHGKL
jgi:hypothetical protein